MKCIEFCFVLSFFVINFRYYLMIFVDVLIIIMLYLNIEILYMLFIMLILLVLCCFLLVMLFWFVDFDLLLCNRRIDFNVFFSSKKMDVFFISKIMDLNESYLE